MTISNLNLLDFQIRSREEFLPEEISPSYADQKLFRTLISKLRHEYSIHFLKNTNLNSLKCTKKFLPDGTAANRFKCYVPCGEQVRIKSTESRSDRVASIIKANVVWKETQITLELFWCTTKLWHWLHCCFSRNRFVVITTKTSWTK